MSFKKTAIQSITRSHKILKFKRRFCFWYTPAQKQETDNKIKDLNNILVEINKLGDNSNALKSRSAFLSWVPLKNNPNSLAQLLNRQRFPAYAKRQSRTLIRLCRALGLSQLHGIPMTYTVFDPTAPKPQLPMKPILQQLLNTAPSISPAAGTPPSNTTTAPTTAVVSKPEAPPITFMGLGRDILGIIYGKLENPPLGRFNQANQEAYAASKNERDNRALAKLFPWVAQATKINEARDMLIKNPALLFEERDVLDPKGRLIQKRTLFQVALGSACVEMSKMIHDCFTHPRSQAPEYHAPESRSTS